MVSVGNGEKRTLLTTLHELAGYRKLQHRTYLRLSDGDQYTCILFAHDQQGNIHAVVQLTAMPQVKEIVPIALFKNDFEQVESYYAPPKVERRGLNADATA